MNPSPHPPQKRHGAQAKRLNIHRTMQKQIQTANILPLSRAAETIANDTRSFARADEDTAMQVGATPLPVTSQQGRQEDVCLLSDAWADKDIAMQVGATPLFIAPQNGHLEVVCLLSDAGADKVIAMQEVPLPCSSHLKVDTSR